MIKRKKNLLKSYQQNILTEINYQQNKKILSPNNIINTKNQIIDT